MPARPAQRPSSFAGRVPQDAPPPAGGGGGSRAVAAAAAAAAATPTTTTRGPAQPLEGPSISDLSAHTPESLPASAAPTPSPSPGSTPQPQPGPAGHFGARRGRGAPSHAELTLACAVGTPSSPAAGVPSVLSGTVSDAVGTPAPMMNTLRACSYAEVMTPSVDWRLTAKRNHDRAEAEHQKAEQLQQQLDELHAEYAQASKTWKERTDLLVGDAFAEAQCVRERMSKTAEKSSDLEKQVGDLAKQLEAQTKAVKTLEQQKLKADAAHTKEVKRLQGELRERDARLVRSEDAMGGNAVLLERITQQDATIKRLEQMMVTMSVQMQQQQQASTATGYGTGTPAPTPAQVPVAGHPHPGPEAARCGSTPSVATSIPPAGCSLESYTLGRTAGGDPPPATRSASAASTSLPGTPMLWACSQHGGGGYPSTLTATDGIGRTISDGPLPPPAADGMSDGTGVAPTIAAGCSPGVLPADDEIAAGVAAAVGVEPMAADGSFPAAAAAAWEDGSNSPTPTPRGVEASPSPVAAAAGAAAAPVVAATPPAGEPPPTPPPAAAATPHSPRGAFVYSPVREGAVPTPTRGAGIDLDLGAHAPSVRVPARVPAAPLPPPVARRYPVAAGTPPPVPRTHAPTHRAGGMDLLRTLTDATRSALQMELPRRGVPGVMPTPPGAGGVPVTLPPNPAALLDYATLLQVSTPPPPPAY